MKLIDLEPRWVGLWADFLNGVTFLCPHCRVTRLAIHFRPPIDPHKMEAAILNGGYSNDVKVWTRTSGETFETLTISPSLDFSQPARIDFPAHWHGFITNGEIT